jgi:hypothetical protein
MAFNLKQFSDLVGIDKETSTYNTPVFKKTLEGGILGEANNDGTIFIDKSLKGKAKEKAVSHEKVHLEQMAQGRLHYDDNTVTWKKDTKSPARVYERQGSMLIDKKTGKSAQEGGDFEWEREAYKKQ